MCKTKNKCIISTKNRYYLVVFCFAESNFVNFEII